MNAGILLGGCLSASLLLQGCATELALPIWERNPVRRERMVRFDGLGGGVRVVQAHLVGSRKEGAVERIWKLQGTPLWLYESTTDAHAPVRMGGDSEAVVGELPASPGWVAGSDETLEVLLVFPDTPIPWQALADSGSPRMVLQFDPSDEATQRPVFAIVQRSGHLAMLPVDWRGATRFAPSSVFRLVLVPALALDVLLSPLYLVGVLLFLPGGVR